MCMRGQSAAFVSMCASVHAAISPWQRLRGCRAFVRRGKDLLLVATREDKGIGPIRLCMQSLALSMYLAGSLTKASRGMGSELLSAFDERHPRFCCPAGDAEMSPTGATQICSRGKHVL